MSGYLARLKAANSGNALPDALPKLPNGASGSNGSSPSSTFSRIAPLPDAIPATRPEPEAAQPDPATERRRAEALALLSEHPEWQRAVVVERGKPVVIGVAIRGTAYGEIVLDADYDVPALFALIGQYGGETVH